MLMRAGQDSARAGLFRVIRPEWETAQSMRAVP